MANLNDRQMLEVSCFITAARVMLENKINLMRVNIIIAQIMDDRKWSEDMKAYIRDAIQIHVTERVK